MSLVEQLLGETIGTIASVVTFWQALATARSFRLTAYDAVYLEIARSEGVPLATLDHALRAAATQVGVELLS
jgi:predicted nucleic acid-binding protein